MRRFVPRKPLSAALLALSFAFGPSLGAQPLRLPALNGPDLTTAQLETGNALLVVWTSWSRNCADIVQRINALEARFGGKAKIYAVSFNEDRSAVEQFLAGKKLAVPVVLDADGAFSKKNAITALPGLVVFQEGRITWTGKLPEAPDELLSGLLGK